jgi:hypothetical protein
MTIDHCDIGPTFSMLQAKLINHKRIVPGMLTS